jgi:hypothetical protein
MHESSPDASLRERQLARLLITLYYCGVPVNHLLEGHTRQIESPSRLHQFDFWMREPGHVALALLHCQRTTPASVAALPTPIGSMVARLLDADQVDTRRIPAHGSSFRVVADLDEHLSFLTGAALVSDRPSFNKNQPHQIVLEASGIALAEKILAECPSFGWYRTLGDVIVATYATLQHYDLNTMPYLAPDLTPTMATAVPLAPIIRVRAAALDLSFGEPRHVNV